MHAFGDRLGSCISVGQLSHDLASASHTTSGHLLRRLNWVKVGQLNGKANVLLGPWMLWSHARPNIVEVGCSAIEFIRLRSCNVNTTHHADLARLWSIKPDQIEK